MPAWNEALGLPRPFDQQWSLRMQQILAYETDLLEYGDLFDGNPVVAAKVAELKDGARAELAQIDAMGGAVAAIDHMKARLVEANAERIARIETGETMVVGVNRWTEAEPSPLLAGEGAILTVDAAAEGRPDRPARRLARGARPGRRWPRRWRRCGRRPPRAPTSCRPRSRRPGPGSTTGEWGAVIRAAFGEYRAPTGVCRNPSNRTEGLDEIARPGRCGLATGSAGG